VFALQKCDRHEERVSVKRPEFALLDVAEVLNGGLMDMRKRLSIASEKVSGVAMWLATMVLAVGLGFSLPASAEQAKDSTAKLGPKDVVLSGDAKCTTCHDETEKYPVLAIGKTKHVPSPTAALPPAPVVTAPARTHQKAGRSEGTRQTRRHLRPGNTSPSRPMPWLTVISVNSAGRPQPLWATAMQPACLAIRAIIARTGPKAPMQTAV